MSFTIGSISWPSDNREAIRLYLEYAIKTLAALHITFPSYSKDPIEVAKGYIAGTITSEACHAESISWWKIIDDQDAIRDFQNEHILLARLAVCLLSIKENDTPNLGENLSWFIEVLDSMNADTDRAVEIMIEHFSPTPNKI